VSVVLCSFITEKHLLIGLRKVQLCKGFSIGQVWQPNLFLSARGTGVTRFKTPASSNRCSSRPTGSLRANGSVLARWNLGVAFSLIFKS
jgi:hypothetical protein